MEKKNEVFGNFDIQQAMRLANSDTGRQLLTLLQATQGDALQGAMDQAAAGNYDQLKKTVQQLLSNDQARQLVEKMGSDNHGPNGR